MDLSREPSKYSELELLQKLADGNEDAFRQIFDIYQKRIYSYAYKVTGSQEVTEDILQDVFLQIWTMRQKLTGIENFNAYLHRVAHNAAYKSLEKVAKEELVVRYLKTQSANQEVNEATNVFNQLLSKEIKQQIQQLVEQLTPRQREVFLLSREGGLKNEEIAQKLGIGYESVKSHLADALKFLRKELREQYGMHAIAIFIIYRLGNF